MLKLGLIGWSREAERLHDIILRSTKGVELVGVSSSQDAVIQRFRRNSSVKIAETDYRRLLGFHELDAVYIAAGTDTDMTMAIEALEAGLHVLLAHPLATNVSDAYTIKGKVDHYTTQYGTVALKSRADANFKKVKQMISKGICGDIRSIHIHVQIPYQSPLPQQSLPIKAGLYMDELTEEIDLIHWLGDSVFADVHARGRVMQYDHLAKQKDIDTAMISGRLKSGVLVQTSAVVSAVQSPRTDLHIVGSTAAIRCTEASWSPTITIIDEQGSQSVRTTDTTDPLQSVLLDFADAVAYKRSPQDTLLPSIYATQVAVAMSKSDILKEETSIDI
jgi:predicted dehydrogenase